jgi:predicted DNA-binding WGR domain protein
MRYALSLLLVVCSVFTLNSAPARAHDPRPDEPRPRIQIALLLDTSNSMDGLINQAKTQLWRIVNQFAHTHHGGKSPRIEVALYQYGNDSLVVTEGFIQQVLPFTDDLDLISEKLFALRTNGGEEYCGEVISKAMHQLDWSSDPHTYKAIFIAGNEPFTQGHSDYREACAKAFGRDIFVNTIHCGRSEEGVAGSWSDGARIGGGKAMNINQDRIRPTIHCPQDDEIRHLNSSLNETYIPYGPRGGAAAANQVAQDANAEANASVGSDVARAAAKASGAYQNAGWDLVDAVTNNQVKVEEVADKDLPENMQKMDQQQRKGYVDQQRAKRSEIQKQILELNKAREAYLVTEEKKLNDGDKSDTLDSAMLDAIREQVKAKGFETRD